MYLEVLVLVAGVATILGLARKGRGKRRFNLRKVTISSQSVAGALTTLDVVSNPVVSASANAYRIITMDASYGNEGFTVGEGPVTFGLAHSDYSAAEVEECLEAVGAIDIGDKVAQEQANRLVRQIGIMQTQDAEAFENGRRIKVKLNWHIGIGDQVNLWIKNKDANTLTTGGRITIDGALWVKDSV